MDDMLSLMKHDFKVVQLGAPDVMGDTDHLRALGDLIYAHEEMYPGIDKWFDGKVKDGLRFNERIGYVGYLDERPVVSCVIKRDRNAKLCHIKIADELQGMKYGRLFVTLMALEVRGTAKEMHLTLPEGLWQRKNKFFQSFGFENAVRCHTQYRAAEEELLISAPYESVWKHSLERMPELLDTFLSIGGLSISDSLLMSIQPKWANKIMSGKKKVEIRKKFNPKWIGKTIKIYSSSPEQAIVGEAVIGSVDTGSPEYIWMKHGHETGCTREEYFAYCGAQIQVSAIILREIRRYPESMPLRQLEHLIKANLSPPQSYCSLNKNKSWAEAISVATLLQNHFSFQRPLVIQL